MGFTDIDSRPKGEIEIKQLRVVVADDDSSVRMLLRVALGTTPGLTVVGEARDGEEAVLMAKRERPDVVVLDHMMPLCTGAVAARRIKKMSPKTDVVFFSAYEHALPDVAAELNCTVVLKAGLDQLERVLEAIGQRR